MRVMHVVAGPSGSGKTSAFPGIHFGTEKQPQPSLRPPSVFANFWRVVSKSPISWCDGVMCLTTFTFPGRFSHRLGKIDRRRQALCTKIFRELFGSTLNRKYHAEVNVPCSSEIIALFFHSSEYIAVIVIGVIQIILRLYSQPSTG